MDVKGKTEPLFRTAADREFLESLQQFICGEKECLSGPEHRYNIYKAAFDKVIDHATLYKMLLTSIKKEYDDFIAAVKTNNQRSKLAHKKLKAMETQPTSLMNFQRRAAQLQDRIAVIQRDTADVRNQLQGLEEIRKNQLDSPKQETLDSHERNPVGQIPGLTFSESLNPEALDKHLLFLKQKRDNLLSKIKSQYVPRQEKDALDFKMRTSLNQRDALILENNRLQRRFTQLTCLSKALSSWEKTSSRPPLLEFLSSKLEHVSEMKVSETDSYGIKTDDEFEEDDPEKVHKSKLLLDYIERFSDLFNSGEYEAAAYHAAKSPHGVLRNMETMMRFKSVSVYERQLPPVLLFFQALMLSAQPGKQVPGERMSLEGVRCALQYNYIQLATFGVTQQRLSYSEELGDMICNHGDKDPRIADTCLALAQIIFTACGAVKKAVLSMCRRGLTSGALEHIYKNRDFTVEDLIFVLRECPSLSLLEDLTQPYGGNPALLSVGFICHYLLSAGLEDLAFQLLEKIYTDGQGALQQTILDDVMCSAEGWSEIAARCVQRERPQLAQGIISTLLSQPGAMCLPQEQESAKLMEHVFM
ncbi:clathrin heavy chain linker domain-containing protein 1 isoform X1 [Astyanax mexicanus]|uniref:Clathrin heavy chain linker domain-containing protein 1 n=2 Tax=Astyanax mexicanus TaxID=7994 RepID=A0A8T2KS90_ASTMX|nr:clathrin heavy chain linker domain-containing protein 1 isoform X1 [Astyanax mexicanus]